MLYRLTYSDTSPYKMIQASAFVAETVNYISCRQDIPYLVQSFNAHAVSPNDVAF